MAADIKFIRGTRPESLEGLNQNAIYFFTNTQEIYMGGKIYGVDPATITAIQGAITALQGADVTLGGRITDLESWKTTASTTIAENTAAAAQGISDAAAAQRTADALAEFVGSLPEDAESETVIAYISEAIAAALVAPNAAIDAIGKRVTQAEKDIDAIEADYLKAADKTELEGKITAEAQAREAADNALDLRVDEIEKFFAVTGEEQIKEAYDTLVEIQTYIDEHGEAAAEMVKNIATNASDIDALEGRMDTAEGDIDNLEGRMTTAENEIDALQALFGSGEGSVSDMIADAVAAEKAEREAADATLTTGVNEAKAAAKTADDKAVQAQNEVDALELVVDTKAAASVVQALDAEVDAIAERVVELEKIDHDHENKEVLDGISALKVSAWDAAETNAKAYADSLLTWGTL